MALVQHFGPSTRPEDSGSSFPSNISQARRSSLLLELRVPTAMPPNEGPSAEGSGWAGGVKEQVLPLFMPSLCFAIGLGLVRASAFALLTLSRSSAIHHIPKSSTCF